MLRQNSKLKSVFVIAIYCLPLIVGAAILADKVVVEKSSQTLTLLKNGKVLKKYHVVFGANPEGHKQKQGDERTPEGNYTLDSKNSHSGFYKSIHISYPSRQDRERARKAHVNPGGDIMIHGQKNGYEWLSFISQYFNWTDGCIAVKNNEMDEIWKAVRPGTPIEIKP